MSLAHRADWAEDDDGQMVPPAPEQDLRCVVCDELLLACEAVTLLDEPVCGPCNVRAHQRDQRNPWGEDDAAF
jgi:hypothetical protein